MNEGATDLEPGTVAAEIAGDARSILKQIAERRDKREDYLTLDIPTWDGELRARYEILGTDEIQKMIRRQRTRAAGNSKNPSIGAEADADFLIKSCIGIFAYDVENDVEVEIAKGYDLSIAQILEPKDKDTGAPIEIKTERQLVMYLMGWENIVVQSHAQKVGRWMQNPSLDVSDPQ